MNINVWWCEPMKVWRWTITETNRPILKQESGQCSEMSEVMDIISQKLKAVNI